jgi:hypothetical protein
MRFWFNTYPRGRIVIVNLKSGEAFRGALWKCYPGAIVLIQAELLKSRGETVQIQGEVWVDRRNVAFTQAIT